MADRWLKRVKETEEECRESTMSFSTLPSNSSGGKYSTGSEVAVADEDKRWWEKVLGLVHKAWMGLFGRRREREALLGSTACGLV